MVVTTYSGIIVILDGPTVTATGLFPIVSFDYATDTVDSVEKEGNFHSELTVVLPSAFFSGGIAETINFDAHTGAFDQVEKEGNFRREVTFINPRFDLSFPPLTGASGITVVDFGFNIVGGYIPVPRTNQRFFPVAVEISTLFPGDKPRGQPLN